MLSKDNTSCSSFLSNPHCLYCSTSDLYFVKNCWIDSKLLDCKALSSFSNMFPQSSSCFPNNDSRLSQSYLGVFNPSIWNLRYQEMWVQRNPNASSNRFKNLFFSIRWWGSVSLPIFILNVIPWFWPHGIEIVHDVYIVWKSWQGAQGQSPAIDWCFMYRWSRSIHMVMVMS